MSFLGLGEWDVESCYFSLPPAPTLTGLSVSHDAPEAPLDPDSAEGKVEGLPSWSVLLALTDKDTDFIHPMVGRTRTRTSPLSALSLLSRASC